MIALLAKRAVQRTLNKFGFAINQPSINPTPVAIPAETVEIATVPNPEAEALKLRREVDAKRWKEMAQQQQVQTETAQPKRISVTSPSSMGEFIVDDLKLFVSPVTAVMDELKRQLKR
jgi:hypothetical protein